MSKKPDFQEVMHKAGAFRESMILFTAVELDLFSCLEERLQTAPELANNLGTDSRALEILLDALVATGFLTKTGSGYVNTDQSRIFLTRQSEDYRGAILRHLYHSWSLWGNLTETVRKGKPDQAADSFLFSDPQKNRDYIWGMDNVGQDRAKAICAVLDFSECKKMLDLGCGAATYSINFLKKYPDLKSSLFDLPLSLQVARENVEKNGLSGRVDYLDGDFFKKDFGSDYDLVWVSQVLHGHSQDHCRGLIKKSYTALAPGGLIVIHDFLLNKERIAPYLAVLFSVHMLAVTEGGRSYSGGELEQWLDETGFEDIRTIRVDRQSSLVQGVKPA